MRYLTGLSASVVVVTSTIVVVVVGATVVVVVAPVSVVTSRASSWAARSWCSTCRSAWSSSASWSWSVVAPVSSSGAWCSVVGGGCRRRGVGGGTGVPTPSEPSTPATPGTEPGPGRVGPARDSPMSRGTRRGACGVATRPRRMPADVPGHRRSPPRTARRSSRSTPSGTAGTRD